MKWLVFESHIAVIGANIGKLQQNQLREWQNLAPDLDSDQVPDIADPELDPNVPAADDFDPYGYGDQDISGNGGDGEETDVAAPEEEDDSNVDKTLGGEDWQTVIDATYEPDSPVFKFESVCGHADDIPCWICDTYNLVDADFLEDARVRLNEKCRIRNAGSVWVEPPSAQHPNSTLNESITAVPSKASSSLNWPSFFILVSDHRYTPVHELTNAINNNTNTTKGEDPFCIIFLQALGPNLTFPISAAATRRCASQTLLQDIEKFDLTLGQALFHVVEYLGEDVEGGSLGTLSDQFSVAEPNQTLVENSAT